MSYSSLTLPLAEPRELDGRPFWSVEDRYTITPNNLAANYYQTLPLQQLLDQITTGALDAGARARESP